MQPVVQLVVQPAVLCKWRITQHCVGKKCNHQRHVCRMRCSYAHLCMTTLMTSVSIVSMFGYLSERWSLLPLSNAAFYWARELMLTINMTCKSVPKHSRELEIS